MKFFFIQWQENPRMFVEVEVKLTHNNVILHCQTSVRLPEDYPLRACRNGVCQGMVFGRGEGVMFEPTERLYINGVEWVVEDVDISTTRRVEDQIECVFDFDAIFCECGFKDGVSGCRNCDPREWYRNNYNDHCYDEHGHPNDEDDTDDDEDTDDENTDDEDTDDEEAETILVAKRILQHQKDDVLQAIRNEVNYDSHWDCASCLNGTVCGCGCDSAHDGW